MLLLLQGVRASGAARATGLLGESGGPPGRVGRRRATTTPLRERWGGWLASPVRTSLCSSTCSGGRARGATSGSGRERWRPTVNGGEATTVPSYSQHVASLAPFSERIAPIDRHCEYPCDSCAPSIERRSCLPRPPPALRASLAQVAPGLDLGAYLLPLALRDDDDGGALCCGSSSVYPPSLSVGASSRYAPPPPPPLRVLPRAPPSSASLGSVSLPLGVPPLPPLPPTSFSSSLCPSLAESRARRLPLAFLLRPFLAAAAASASAALAAWRLWYQ